MCNEKGHWASSLPGNDASAYTCGQQCLVNIETVMHDAKLGLRTLLPRGDLVFTTEMEHLEPLAGRKLDIMMTPGTWDNVSPVL